LADDVSAVTSAFIENNILMKKFLTRFLYRRQDIEDVVQEAYLRAYKAEKEAVIDQPKAFLFRVARNIALNELKSKSHHITDYIEECDTQVLNHVTPTLEDELQAQQHLGLYCEAIASLPPQCRKVSLLRKAHGLKHKEIAGHLGITVSSVEKHLRKGALACEAFLRAREEDAGDLHNNQNRGPSSTQKGGLVAVDRSSCSTRELG
jgi:RNA polymerase sigma-70 factor (ECF subfamily)